MTPSAIIPSLNPQLPLLLVQLIGILHTSVTVVQQSWPRHPGLDGPVQGIQANLLVKSSSIATDLTGQQG